MRSASTSDRTQFILYDVCNGSRAKPVCFLQYQDDTDTWQYFGDVQSFGLEMSNENRQYGKIFLCPPAQSLSARIDNSRGLYSPEAGLEFDGVLTRNRKVRALVGYATNDTVSTPYNFNVSTEYEKLYHTQVISGKVYNDIAAATLRNYNGITEDFNFYGSGTYSDGLYSAEGYYVSDVLDLGFPRFDLEILKTLTIESDTTGIEIFYRSSMYETDLSSDTLPFTSLGNTINGSKDFSLADLQHRYFQFAAVFKTGTWSSTSGYITNVVITYEQSSEVFTHGDYLMDDPSFNMAHGSYDASFSARDYFKRALETQVTCPTYTSVDCAVILRDVADRAGIPHDDGDELIPTTGYTVTIADDDNFKQTTALSIFNEVMEYLYSKNENYRLELSTGYLRLVIKSAVTSTADWQMDYRYNMISMSRGYLSDKLIQRVTVLSKEHTTDVEKELAYTYHTVPVTNQELTWTNESMYLRLYIFGGAFTLNEIDLINKKINYDATPDSSGTVAITVSGCELNIGFTGYFGESIYYSNAANSEGFTIKIINRLIQSDAEAQAIAEALTSTYGAPAYRVNVRIPCNPLLELGDRILIWERYSNTNTVYRIDSISISYDASGAALYQDIALTDLGEDFGELIWDRNGAETGANDLQYDIGLVWDQDLGPLVTEDTTDYEYMRPVLFS